MDDELTPQETERVRRLLADARHTEPIPDEVAARIDRALAGVVAEPAPETSVVPLAERRRRAGRLLLAAAAVVVGGVAVGQVVDGGGTSSSDESAATSSEVQDRGLPAPDRDSDQADGTELESDAELPGAVAGSQRSFSRLAPREIRSDRFALDAERLRPLATAEKSSRNSLGTAPQAADSVDGCAPGVWGGGRYVRVALDDDAGWLVYRAPRGGTQVVDLFLCGEDSPERSATLPFD